MYEHRQNVCTRVRIICTCVFLKKIPNWLNTWEILFYLFRAEDLEIKKSPFPWGSGLKMSIYRDAPFSAIYWMLNEIIREKLKDSQYLGSFSRSFIAGATAGSLAALLTTPFDVIKTRIQTDTTSSSLGNKSLIQFYHKEGLQSLFIGWQQRCLRTALACALMLGTYEFTKEQYNKHLTSEKS